MIWVWCCGGFLYDLVWGGFCGIASVLVLACWVWGYMVGVVCGWVWYTDLVWLLALMVAWIFCLRVFWCGCG